jgi:hypothetical protein
LGIQVQLHIAQTSERNISDQQAFYYIFTSTFDMHLLIQTIQQQMRLTIQNDKTSDTCKFHSNDDALSIFLTVNVIDLGILWLVG